MSGRKFAIIDPSAGISGDMLLGALIDAGAPGDWLHELPGRLGLPGVTVETRPTERCGIRMTRVTVRSPEGASEGPGGILHTTGDPGGRQHEAEGSERDPAGHAHHPGPHRHVRELIGIVERAPLSENTRALAVRALSLIAEAEGRVHGLAPERVSLHEVGALDALVDIVGAIEGFEQLGVDQVYSLPVAIGNGWVTTAHGRLPVPAPATALLLEGLEVASGGPVSGEATTPTGAALLRVLSRGEPPGRWRQVGTGWGAGTRNPPGYPNGLRLLLAQTVRESGNVVLLATDVDDLSPEYLEPLREALTSAGSLDVQIWPVQMKKGRLGFRIEAIAPPDRADAVAEALFRHSSTAGLRRMVAERMTLERREWVWRTEANESVRMKTVQAPGGARTKPEYDDVVTLSQRTGRPAHQLARELLEASKESE